MDAYHKLLTGFILGLTLLGAFLAYQWLQAHDAALKAEAKISADQANLEKLVTQQKEFADQLVALRQEQQQQLAAVKSQFGQAQSPAQIASLVAQVMGLKTAPVIVTPAPTADNPNPKPVAQVDLADAPTVKKYLQDCEECKINHVADQKALALSAQDQAVERTKLSLMTDERDQWKKAATGGSWIKRAGKRIGYFAEDAVIVGILLYGSGHKR